MPTTANRYPVFVFALSSAVLASVLAASDGTATIKRPSEPEIVAECSQRVEAVTHSVQAPRDATVKQMLSTAEALCRRGNVQFADIMLTEVRRMLGMPAEKTAREAGLPETGPVE